MRILAGLQFGGATLTAFDDLGPGEGSIGHATWGPAGLLRDLELRLGLGVDAEPEALRVATWAERMMKLTPLGRFYSRSFEVDPLGTARTVLELRDLLVSAAWDGQPIPGGGSRLEAIHELESLELPAVPAGVADRLTTVARALEASAETFYATLMLAEPHELWPSRWQHVFRSLARAGTSVEVEQVALAGASSNSDLGRVQEALRTGVSVEPVAFLGDGSLVHLTAETSWEAARATAAILAGLPAEGTVVIRDADVSALDNALLSHGLRSQGWRSRSPWRAALQVLPLALELGFEPKDPYRVLELLTLPVGPFQGRSGHRLARALAEAPGIGSPHWEEAKRELSELGETPESLARISEWLEHRGADAVSGASKEALLTVIARVRSFIVSRVASAPEDPILLAAAGHAAALRVALEGDPRSTFSLVEVRRLAESVLSSGTSVQLEEERAGRIDHASSPGSLRVPRQTVVWWSFVDDGTARNALPWRCSELLALSKAGIHFPEPRARLRQRADEWRRAILAATGRVLLVTPRSVAGASMAPHPLWDEIVARTGANEQARARIELRARELLASPSTQSLLAPPLLDALEPLCLPGGHPEWATADAGASPVEYFSPTSLNELLGCPLKWALHYRGGIRSRGHTLPPLLMLNGTLGHRLVELLHAQGAFGLDDVALETGAKRCLDELFPREGAVLLRPGMALEREQLRHQLVSAVLELSRTLRTAELRIIAVEKRIDITWGSTRLKGSIDLVVATEDGVRSIIDLKWGGSSYRELLKSGQALQLAAYAFAEAAERGAQALPEAAYFSMKQARMLGLVSSSWPGAERIDGPRLDETWARVERSSERATRTINRGSFPVVGLRRSLPLLASLGVDDTAQGDHFALDAEGACKYCDLDALCGRRWEAAE